MHGPLPALIALLLVGCTRGGGTGETGEPCAEEGHADLDGDGFGDPETPTCGGVADATDCDDADAEVHPGAAARCGDDADCDGERDDCSATWGVADAAHHLLGAATAEGFGSSLAVSGDTLLVGVQRASPSGGVRLYEGPLEASELSADDAAAALYLGGVGERAGVAVCAGDLLADGASSWAVGTRPSPEAASPGRVFLVGRGSGGDLALGGGIGGEVDGDLFGLAVACGADGVALVVGARGQDAAGEDAGAAYVFREGLDEVEGAAEAALRIDGAEAGDYAGRAVAVGDLDGDGRDDVVVGAYRASLGARWEGAVHVLYDPGSGTVGLGDADATVRGPSEGAVLGRTVAAGGDVDGDGLADLLIGAPGASETVAFGGVVLLFTGPPDGEVGSDAATAQVVSDRAEGFAGIGLHLGGDLDGDGYGEVVVGAPGEIGDGGESAVAGRAWLWYGPVVGTLEAASADRTVASDASGDSLGYSVAVAPAGLSDLPLLLVGARFGDGEAARSGAVHAFYGAPH